MDMAQQIERYIRNDRQSVDLLYKLKLDDPYIAKGRTAFSGLSEHDYPRHEGLGVPLFQQSWHHSFPQELRDQFQHMQSNFATGLLPSIMRAWMSIDSDLYLWNFENNRDLAYYDAINNTILHVNIVPSKLGFTYAKLHSILVVVTTVDILLLALSFQDSAGHVLPSDSTAGELKAATLLMVGGAPLYKLPLDGLIVSDLCTTQNGRIFFAASDCLYELDYYGKGWFGTGGGCRKTNHSKRLINYLVPVLQIFYAKDVVFQLAIDDSRHLLYVLMKSGCIQLFDLGVDGRSIQKFGALYREHIEHMAREACSVQPELFHEIVALTPIPLTHSANVNLIATTSKGVRIYISCLANPVAAEEISQEALRPSALRVLHIRFPPESPSTAPHLLNIYSTHQTHDCMLMAAPGPNDSSLLLAHSSACFAFNNQLTEHIVQQRICGNVWKIVHFRPKKSLKDRPRDGLAVAGGSGMASPLLSAQFGSSSDYPLFIDQHQCPLEKFYVITSKGIYVFEHCSPLELFRRSLNQFGMDSKQFQALANTLPHIELCTMALCVLSSDQASDQAIKDMALRVFFHFGGGPKLCYGTHEQLTSDGVGALRARGSMAGGDGYMNGTLSANTSTFMLRTPLRTSTPQSGGGSGGMYMNGHTPHHQHLTPGAAFDGDQSIVAGAQLLPSPRHEALHTMFARIVKELWRRNLCNAQPTNNVYSLLNRSEVEQAGHQLAALRQAIDEHHLLGNAPPHIHHHLVHLLPPIQQYQQQQKRHSAGESNLAEQERQTLQKLRTLIGTACEVLALWGVLLEHELHVIFVMLTPDVQKRLLYWTLEDLVRSAQEVCADLITALIRFYIGDDASTTAISERLRQLCPSLFTVDDASVVRATESIYRAKASIQPRPEVIQEAVVQLRKSIQRLNLVQTCDLLVQVLHFEGIVDLSLTRAYRDDPNDLALVAYKKHIGGTEMGGTTAGGPTSSAVAEAWRKRQEAYNCILETLRLLHTLAISRGGASELAQLRLGQCPFPSADACKGQLSPTQAQLERDKVILRVLDSDDELACVAVYQWMLANGLADKLIEQKPRYFESFLFHEIEAGKGAAYTELLWKYHERSGNYLDAARVLTEMASKSTSRVNINQRITYLSHALMCVQSAAETRANTELRQSIQDKLDVAQIQLRTKALLDSDIAARAEATPRGRETLETLSYQLCTLTDLYRFANIYGLEEVKLAVLQCAGKYDREVVEGVWQAFLQKELSQFAPNRNAMDQVQKTISSQLLRLRKRYTSSQQYVPLEFILRELLLFCFRHTAPIDWLLELCRGAEMPSSKLLAVASEQYRLHDPFWRQNQRAHQFMLELALSVTERCRDDIAQKRQPTLGRTERKVLKNTCLEFLAALQLNMQQQDGRRGATRGAQAERLELLQAQLDQML